MSRDRPTTQPPALPDSERGIHRRETQQRQRREIEVLKRVRGPGLLAGLMKAPTNPLFIRPSYESSIVEKLGEFFRARSWRMRHCRPGATWKERVRARRRLNDHWNRRLNLAEVQVTAGEKWVEEQIMAELRR